MSAPRHYILHPLAEEVGSELFDPQYLTRYKRGRRVCAGRGGVVFFEHGGHSLVLRHYRRGGLPAHLSDDHYLWPGWMRSRPWREYHLLRHLQALALPAPQVYAAHARRRGWRYTANIITHRIATGRSLANCLHEGDPADPILAAAGATIRRFHDCGVDHVDLNASNILLTDRGAAWLLDFDRCRLRNRADRGWKHRNLLRLQRSLSRLPQAADPTVAARFWRVLHGGYEHPPHHGKPPVR